MNDTINDKPVLKIRRGKPKGESLKVSGSLSKPSSLKANATKEFVAPIFKESDILEVLNRDERYAYRWLNVNKLTKNGGRDIRGWEVINTMNSCNETSNLPVLGDRVNAIDNTIRVGDLVLARMAKETANARNEFYRKKASKRSDFIHLKNKFKNVISGNIEKTGFYSKEIQEQE